MTFLPLIRLITVSSEHAQDTEEQAVQGQRMCPNGGLSRG